jgi:hypothetical protein
MRDATRLRLLRIGVKHLGEEQLAAKLKATPARIEAWMNDPSCMPDRAFLVLVDLLDEIGQLGDEA